MAEMVRCSASTTRSPMGSRTSARRSTPAVGASQGVSADAAEADAAVATSTAAGAHAATAAFSGSAGGARLVCGRGRRLTLEVARCGGQGNNS